MSKHIDYKQDIDAWTEMWDEMLEKGVHPQVEKPKTSDFAKQIFGDDPADSYYDYLYGEEELFSEEDVITTQNPVRMDTVGPDNKQPEPVWVKEDLLDELQQMKDRLFKLENEFAQMGQGKEFKEDPVDTTDDKMMSKFESLRKQINKLSDELGIANEPSPYKIKRK
jgi:hypothetical protein